MSHPTEGELRAFLDGEIPEGKTVRIREHLADCSRCRTVRDELVGNESLVREALDRVVGEPDVVHARRAVEERLAEPGRDDGPTRGRGWRRPDLFRAAALAVLLLGGVSAALPGSPVNTWLLRTLDRGAPVSAGDAGRQEGPQSRADGSTGTPERADDVGIRVEPREGTIQVELTEVSPGTRVEIVLVDADRVGISAPRADGFRSGSGVVGVTAPGELITIELPRWVTTAEVRSEGRVLLRKDGGSLEFPTIMPESEGGAFVLTIPATDPVGDG